MIKFRFEIDIRKPVNEVHSMFINRNLLPKWQPGLLSDESVEEKNEKERYKLTYRIGRRNMIIMETIIKNTFPDYVTQYDMKGIRNPVQNEFRSGGENSTIWVSVIEFRFKGIMKLVGIFMRSGLEQQSRIIMKNFKAFAEKL